MAQITMTYEGETITLTTDHAASNYGQPVCIIRGNAYGPCDQDPTVADDDLFANAGPHPLNYVWRTVAGFAYRTGTQSELVDRFVALGKSF